MSFGRHHRFTGEVHGTWLICLIDSMQLKAGGDSTWSRSLKSETGKLPWLWRVLHTVMENINTSSSCCQASDCAHTRILTRLPLPSPSFIKGRGRGKKSKQQPQWRHCPPRNAPVETQQQSVSPSTASPEVQIPRVDEQGLNLGTKARGGDHNTEISIWIISQIWRMPLTVMMLLLTSVAQCWGASQVGFPFIYQVETRGCFF